MNMLEITFAVSFCETRSACVTRASNTPLIFTSLPHQCENEKKEFETKKATKSCATYTGAIHGRHNDKGNQDQGPDYGQVVL